MNKAVSKGKSDASAIAVPAKRSANVLVPEEVLRTMASSLNAATLALMDLPCGDVAARGRAVAIIADCKRRINDLLGIQRRGISVLAVSDTIVDVFQFLRRKELDTLQLLSKRFNVIIVNKLSLVCLRQLWCAKKKRAQGQLVLLMGEVGAKKLTR